MRWASDGTRIVRWEGARRESEALGISSTTEAGVGRDMADRIRRDLSGVRSDTTLVDPYLPPPLSFDPASDRIAFGGDWALNPLADSAVYHYRYSSGDTLRITLPGADRGVVLAEVRVEPRRAEFRLVSASLWCDTADGSLVRAGYRPARPFDMAIDGDGDVPEFLGPIRAEIRYVSIDHGLYDLRWWIPRRFAFDGEATVGTRAAFPIHIEWTLDDMRVNEATALVPEVAPDGWILREVELERDDRPLRVTVVVPPATQLATSPELSSRGGTAPSAFREEELEDLRRTLLQLSPAASLAGFRVTFGLRSGVTRYNRVEGLSTGIGAWLALPSLFALHGEARLGLSDREPLGALRIERGTPDWSQSVGVYRRLDPSSEWAAAHTVASSVETVLWGGERTPYHRAWGVETVASRSGRRVRASVRLFGERQRTAVRTTHAHLARLWNDHPMPENPPATEGWWRGVGLGVRWEVRDDPGRVHAFGRFEAEAGTGPTDYARAWTSVGLTGSLPHLAGAVEAGVGGSAGALPLQRHFFPGGAAVFRGALAGEHAGEAFWFARAELGPASPGLRLVTFADWMAVGARDRLGEVETLVAVGAGVSIMNGLMRLDVARNLRGQRDWRLDAYLDGLF